MIHNVGLVNYLSQEMPIHDAVKTASQGVVRPQMTEVFNGPRAQVVQHNDAVSARQQGLRQVRPDETRTTRNQ